MTTTRWPRYWLGTHSLRRLDTGTWHTHCDTQLPDSPDITDQTPDTPCSRCAAELARLDAAHREADRARALLRTPPRTRK